MLPTRRLQQVGYVNFYQYPPMRPLPEEDRGVLLAGMGLEELHPGAEFTLFLSVPYCRVRCHSCPFFKEFLPRVNTEEALDRYLDLVEMQAAPFAAAPRFQQGILRAVYLGGGTASVLRPAQVARFITFLRQQFRLAPDAEITLEGNPTDFTPPYLAAARAAGVNRVSLGYQSSHEGILRQALNSPHSANQGLDAIKAALAAGFLTVNIDLMYRMPTQTRKLWEQDIELMLALRPQSITMNEYIVHDGSPSQKLITRGRLPQQVERLLALDWYASARDRLRAAGYLERRMGTFILPGHEQQYGKLTYGLSTDCVGIGAGAYGFVNGHMYASPSNPDVFAKILMDGYPIAASRASPRASARNLMERWIFSCFRKGSVDRGSFRDRFASDVVETFSAEFAELEAQGLITITCEAITLTERGFELKHAVSYMFYADEFRVSV